MGPEAVLYPSTVLSRLIPKLKRLQSALADRRAHANEQDSPLPQLTLTNHKSFPYVQKFKRVSLVGTRSEASCF